MSSPAEMAGEVAALAAEACAELGLPALLLAGGEPGRAPWVVATGYGPTWTGPSPWTPATGSACPA